MTDLRTYSEQRIGQQWSAEDHAFLDDKLRQIDELAAALAQRNAPKGAER